MKLEMDIVKGRELEDKALTLTWTQGVKERKGGEAPHIYKNKEGG